MVAGGSCEQLIQGKSRVHVGHDVVHMGGMLGGHWPQTDGRLVMPTKLCMQKLRPGLGKDIANGSFCHSILALAPNSRKTDPLILLMDFVNETLCCGHAIVSVVTFDLDS